MKERKCEDLNLDEVLKVLANWDVKHKKKIMRENDELEGEANPQKQRVLISDNNCHAERIYTIIHELYHASDFNRGFNSPEADVERRTNKTYKKLYGHRYMQ